MLSGVRVLDLSRWVAGEYATKLFADFGADVVKVEKPGEGSLTRRWGPFPDDRPDPERSALFLHLNTNKRSVALDLHDAADREVLLRLVRERARGRGVLPSRPPRAARPRPRRAARDQPAAGRHPDQRVRPDRSATATTRPAAWCCRRPAARCTPPARPTGSRCASPACSSTTRSGAAPGRPRSPRCCGARRTGRGATIDVSGQEVLLAGADRRASYLLSAVVLRHDRAARCAQPAPARRHLHRPVPRRRRVRDGLRDQPGVLEPLRPPGRRRATPPSASGSWTARPCPATDREEFLAHVARLVRGAARRSR